MRTMHLEWSWNTDIDSRNFKWEYHVLVIIAVIILGIIYIELAISSISYHGGPEFARILRLKFCEPYDWDSPTIRIGSRSYTICVDYGIRLNWK